MKFKGRIFGGKHNFSRFVGVSLNCPVRGKAQKKIPYQFCYGNR